MQAKRRVAISTPLNNSLLKGFEILGLFTINTREISAATLVDRLGMNNATAHRFLMTLEHAGAIRSTKRGFFSLGPKIEELGGLAEDSDSFSLFLAPAVDGLCRELQESVMACRFTRHGPACVTVANAQRAISVNINVGTLLPALSSAQGRIWLSELSPSQRKSRIEELSIAGQPQQGQSSADLERELEDVRQQGFATNLGLNEPDIGAVAVPVRGRTGAAVLTLSVFGMLSRFTPEFVEKAKQRLTVAADRLRDKL